MRLQSEVFMLQRGWCIVLRSLFQLRVCLYNFYLRPVNKA
jgi:hypothetical protein